MRLRFFIAALTVCIAVAPFALAQQFSSLEERMSTADFKAAGLDKLSPEELAKLNAFVRSEVNKGASQGHAQAVEQAQLAEDARIGFRDYHGDIEAVDSTIPGIFTGWQQGSTFTLANGQIWHVVEADSPLEGIKMSNPVVHISKGLLGDWQLRVEGYNKMAKVEREK